MVWVDISRGIEMCKSQFGSFCPKRVDKNRYRISKGKWKNIRRGMCFWESTRIIISVTSPSYYMGETTSSIT